MTVQAQRGGTVRWRTWVVNEYGEGNEAEAVDAWIEEHPDFIDGLTG